MESLRELFIKLGLSVNAAEFAEGLAWEHALEKAAHAVVEAVERIGEAFIQAVEKTAQYGEDMEVLSQKTGIGVEAIQKLGYAATLSHSSAEEMTTALGHLARKIESAKDGSEEAVKGFTNLGISMADVRTKSPEEMVFIIADRMKALGAGSKRTALAMDLLGRTGKNLIPTFDRGADGLRAMGEEADAMGNVMGDKAIKEAAEFKEGLEKMEQVAIGLTHELGSALIEGLMPLLHGMLEWIKANRQFIGQKLQAFAHGLVTVFQKLAGGVKFLVDQTQRLIGVVKLAAITMAAYAIATGLVAIANQLVTVGLGQMLVNWAMNTAAVIYYGIVSLAAGLKAAAAWTMAALPIILITAALVLAALAAEDFYYFLTGGDSVLGHIINTWGNDWAKFMDNFTKPVTGEWYLTAWLRGALAVVMDLEGHLGALAGLVPGVNILKAIADQSLGVVAGEYGPQQEQQDRIRSMQAIYGNSGSPESAAQAQAGSNYVSAPNFQAQVQIVQGPGQSAGAVADAVTAHMDDWWNAKMREVGPMAGRP